MNYQWKSIFDNNQMEKFEIPEQKKTIPLKNNLAAENLFQKFSNCQNSNISKISFIDLITMSKPQRESINISNEEILNEFENKLNYYSQMINFKESQNENLKNELWNFRKWFICYFQNLINFNEATFEKIKSDFEDLKLDYEAKLSAHVNIEEWENFLGSSNGFIEYVHLVLDKINFNADINRIINELIEKSNQIDIDDMNSALFLKGNKPKVFGLKDKEKYKYKNKEKINNDNKNNNNNKNKNNNNNIAIKEVVMTKENDNYAVFCQGNYKSGEYKEDIELVKRMKFWKIVMYFSKREDIDDVLNYVNEIRKLCRKYLITMRNENDGLKERYKCIKVVIVGIVYKRKTLNKVIKSVIEENVKFNCVIRRFTYDSIERCLRDIIDKLYHKHKYIYYTSNFTKHFLKKITT